MTGISYIDATSIAVCHPKRIARNKVFAKIAKLSKSTIGCFFGFKLHLVINEKGEIQGVTLTKGNVDNRKPVPNLTKKLTDLLFTVTSVFCSLPSLSKFRSQSLGFFS